MEEAPASTSTTMVSLSDEVLNQIAVKAATISSNLLTRNNQQMCDFMENSLREKICENTEERRQPTTVRPRERMLSNSGNRRKAPG